MASKLKSATVTKKGKEKVTYVEKVMSKAHMYEDIEIPGYAIDADEPLHEQLEIDWDVIDTSTSKYAKLLQEYDISEVVKSFCQRYAKSKSFYILPKPGNLDLTDKEVGFKDFYATLDEIKDTSKSQNKLSRTQSTLLRTKCQPIISYLLSGNHSKEDKRFHGWKNAVNAAKKAKKDVIMGILSVDLPYIVESSQGEKQYKNSGTQHYVAFAYDLRLKCMYQFDSASKDVSKDLTELYYILKYVVDEMVGHDTSQIIALKYRNILQPGAGDKKEEDERSYNNQNVFCHTWSLWFCLVFVVFYNSSKHTDAMKFLRSLSHRNPVLNLAMIKRFAGWLTGFLQDEDEAQHTAKVRFPIRVYEKAKEKGDNVKVQSLLSQFAIRNNPYLGLNYIWNYKTKSVIKVETLCLRRKVKMDVDLLDTITKVNINAYIEKSKEIRCPIGYYLNKPTKRCRKDQAPKPKAL
jgi:hypothetical protein